MKLENKDVQGIGKEQPRLRLAPWPVGQRLRYWLNGGRYRTVEVLKSTPQTPEGKVRVRFLTSDAIRCIKITYLSIQ